MWPGARVCREPASPGGRPSPEASFLEEGEASLPGWQGLLPTGLKLTGIPAARGPTPPAPLLSPSHPGDRGPRPLGDYTNWLPTWSE